MFKKINGEYFYIPSGILLIFIGYHEDNGIWTPIFSIWGVLCILVGIVHLIEIPGSRKRAAEHDYRMSFVKKAQAVDGGRYEYKRRIGPLSVDLRKPVLSKTGGYCFYCAVDLNDPKENDIWEMDHLWPHKGGGIDDEINLVPACYDCNQGKAWSDPLTYILYIWAVKEFMSKYARSFLIQHKTKSLSYLTNDPYWKGKCDYWFATKYVDLINIVISNNLKVLPDSQKSDILHQAQVIIWEIYDVSNQLSPQGLRYDLREQIKNYKFIQEH